MAEKQKVSADTAIIEVCVGKGTLCLSGMSNSGAKCSILNPKINNRGTKEEPEDLPRSLKATILADIRAKLEDLGC